MKTSPILVLGIGNQLLSDDAVGLHLLRKVEQIDGWDDRVEFIDGGTQGLALLGRLENRQVLIILDAISDHSQPGTIHVLSGSDLLQGRRSIEKTSHECGAKELLAAALLTGDLPKTVTIIGIEPDNLKTSMDLSKPVALAVDQAAARTSDIIMKLLTQLTD